MALWLPVALCLLVSVPVQAENFNSYTDPSDQEVALSEYVMGVRIAVCNSEQWTDKTSAAFKQLFASLANDYCDNLTLCNLVTLNGSIFTPDGVVFLDGYPNWDFTAVHARFVLVYPNAVVLAQKQTRPLVNKQVLSEIIRINLDNLVNNLRWDVLSYEKVPRFDKITEFMNIALLPLGLLIGVIMYGIAYCASTFSSSWTPDVMVAGTGGGKNTAAVRIQEMIEAQKQQELVSCSRPDSQPVLLRVDQLRDHSRPKVTIRGDSDSETATIISFEEERAPRGMQQSPRPKASRSAVGRQHSMGNLSTSNRDLRRQSMADVSKAKMRSHSIWNRFGASSSVDPNYNAAQKRRSTGYSTNLFMRTMNRNK